MWQDDPEDLKLNQRQFLFCKSILAAGSGTTFISPLKQLCRSCSLAARRASSLHPSQPIGTPEVPILRQVQLQASSCLESLRTAVSLSLHIQSRGRQFCVPAMVGRKSFMARTIWYRGDTPFSIQAPSH